MAVAGKVNEQLAVIGKGLVSIFAQFIIDFIKDESLLEGLRFVPNHVLKSYRATENPQFVMMLDSEHVTSVDVNLK